MAIKRMQMYRRNLDGTETRLNPLTEAQYVSMENGQTVQEILSDRDSDKYTPVITNSSSTFKVGQGDNVDLSSSMKEGAYDSCVLKGKTMVNCIQEPSSKDVVLPYEFEDGQYATINDTKESGVLGVELKGQTLVNLLNFNKIIANAITHSKDGGKITVSSISEKAWASLDIFIESLKPNTDYILMIDNVSFTHSDNFISTVSVYCRDGNVKLGQLPSQSSNFFKFNTADKDLSLITLRIHATLGSANSATTVVNGLRVLEYQQGMENWDIPYFEGMTSCKMPILHTVGKNLFDGEIELGSLNVNSGEPTSTTTEIRSKNFTPINGTPFILSRTDSTGSLAMRYYDINKNYLGTGDGGMGAGQTQRICTPPTNARYVKFKDMTSNLSQKIQIEYNTSATSYEDYKTSILSLPEEVVLRSLPNGVCDTFNTRTGVYTQRIKEIVFDGSNDEGWNVFTGDWVLENSTVFYTYISGVKGYTWSKYTGKEAISDKIPSYPDNWLRLNDVLGMTNDNTGARKQFRIPKSYLETDNVNGFRKWLEQNPVTACFELATPIITKVNLSSTLKSWNTTTHIYSEIQENTLYPTLSHSNPTYPVILKPSTKYSIVANSYSNSHTNSAINFNLGGATTSTTVGNRVTTVTTPSTLSNELLTMSGRGNKLNNVMVIEGDVVGDEPYFEGICDCKSPILSNVGKNLFNINGAWEKCSYSMGIPCITYANPKIDIVSQKEFTITTDASGYNNGFGQYIDISTLDEITVEATASFSDAKTSFECKILLLQEGEGLPSSVKTGEDKNFTLRTVSASTSGQRISTNIDTSKFTKMFIMFSGGWKSTMNGSFIFTMKDVYVGDTNQTYEPYKSNTTTFEQKDDKTIVLRSLPSGVCDTLNVETGEYVQRIGEIFFDGTNKQWEVLAYPPHNNNTHYQFKHQLGEGVIGGGLWANAQSILSNTLPSANESLHWGGNGNYGIGGDGNSIMITWKKDVSPFNDIATLNAWLKKNPTIVQYELATPIVSTIDIQGFPYAYKDGHVQLSSGSIEQSLTPTVEYSLSANKTGQINSNTKRVSAHQKQLDDFEAMMLTQMVQSAYDKAILQFDYEMQMMSLGGE